jgi:hypothetical protein
MSIRIRKGKKIDSRKQAVDSKLLILYKSSSPVCYGLSTVCYLLYI